MAGRRPADAGLLGVSDAPMSGSVSKSAPRGAAPRFARPLMRRASLASPKQRFYPPGKTLITPPSSQPLMRPGPKRLADRRYLLLILAVSRIAHGSLFYPFAFRQSFSGVYEGVRARAGSRTALERNGAQRSPPSVLTKEDLVPNHPSALYSLLSSRTARRIPSPGHR